VDWFARTATPFRGDGAAGAVFSHTGLSITILIFDNNQAFCIRRNANGATQRDDNTFTGAPMKLRHF